jgi:hypothetical protein
MFRQNSHVVVVKTVCIAPKDSRPWEKQSRDKSSCNVPWADTSASTRWAIDAKSARYASGYRKRRRSWPNPKTNSWLEHCIGEFVCFSLVLFDFLKCFDRGPDVFLAKIGNLDQTHGDFLSFSDFLKESGSSFRPRRTHAYLMFRTFPQTFTKFRKLVLTKLELPRRVNVSISVHCDFFQAIHCLVDDSYLFWLCECQCDPKILVSHPHSNFITNVFSIVFTEFFFLQL